MLEVYFFHLSLLKLIVTAILAHERLEPLLQIVVLTLALFARSLNGFGMCYCLCSLYRLPHHRILPLLVKLDGVEPILEDSVLCFGRTVMN